ALTSNRENPDSPSVGRVVRRPRATEIVSRVVVAQSDRLRDGQVTAS
ncbi:MAG: hypothetical protein RL033_7744, partial [Pseudomonadota bacterium]